MAWVDASLAASAASTISPTLTADTSTNINFGNGTLETPTSNNITANPSTDAQATSAFGGPATSTLGPSGTGASLLADLRSPYVITALAVSLVLFAGYVYLHKSK